MILDIFVNLLATAIGILIGFVFKEYVRPTFYALIYRGTKICNTWEATQNGVVTANGYPLACPCDFRFMLKQKADRIFGVATAEYKLPVHEIISYKVKGNIKDRFVTLHLCLDEVDRFSHCTLLLEVNNGHLMSGYMSFYAYKAKEINSMEIQCNRIGA